MRCNPVNGGARNVDLQDLGMADGMRFPRRSHNSSVIVMDANVRDPINGYHIPAEASSPVGCCGEASGSGGVGASGACGLGEGGWARLRAACVAELQAKMDW